MPPTAVATLLTPTHSLSEDIADDRESSRHVDEIGAVAVLGAMVEQRRRSSIPSACELENEIEDESDAIATQRRQAVDPQSDVFMKIR